MNIRSICLTGLLAILTVVPGLTAQSVTGTIRGSVKDPAKHRIPGAHVTATNTETKTTYKTISNDSGEYKFDVPAGVYEVSAELLGFNPVKVSNVKVREKKTTQMIALTLSVKTSGPGLTPPLVILPDPPSNRR